MRKITLLSIPLFLCLLVIPQGVLAVVTVTPATGGSAISADTTGGTYITLIGPVISEGVTADIGAGTIILNAPTGFVFDTGGTAPTVLITWISGGNGANGNNINNRATGTSEPITSITSSQISFTITAVSAGSALNSLTWQNVRVRPSAGTPLASGNILKTGTSVIAGVTDGVTNLGTLTEIAGSRVALAYTTQPSSSATTGTDFATKPVIAVRDQFGNTVTSDNTTTITRTAILSTQTCGGTNGSGTLTSAPISGAVVTGGVMTYTAMQYSYGESIKICATSAGLTSALSNTIAVSNPVPVTTSISPATKAAFDSTFTLTVNGSNFVSDSVVQFNGSSRDTAYISPNQLTAEILSSDLTVVGTFNITVLNPAPGGGTSNSQILTINNPSPAISNISPESKVAGSAEFTLTVNGSNFVTGSVVKFDGANRTTVFVTDNQLTATILASDIAVDGVYSITVFNPAPGGGTSNGSPFTVSAIPPPADTTPPSAITDLTLSNATTSSIKLTWTAPGDDGNVGAAASYDIRYSTAIINDGNWASATQFDNEPDPAVAGTSQNRTVFGLSAGTTYYFAMKTSDGIPNTSALSNVPSLQTLHEAPAAVTDLASPEATVSSITLTWTAPGDDDNEGTASSYDIRYSTSFINSGNFSSATQASGLPAPQIAGTSEIFIVTGLSAGTTYYFAMKTADSAPNTSAISNITSRATTTTTTTTTTGTGIATINVVKIVINDNGGTKNISNFSLFVGGTSVISGQTYSFPAPGPVFTVTEANDSNYVRSFSGDCDLNGQFNLNGGDNKFCIVTNNDIGPAPAGLVVPPLIDVVKVPSPLALPNGPGPVTYTYTLRNIGTIPVTNITMVGDTCSPIVLVSGDTNSDTKLDVNETWVYRCTTTLTATYTTNIVATGWANGISAVDIANSTVVVGVLGLPNTGFVPPLIHVTKIPSPLALPAGGGLVTFTKQVTNLGTVALSNIRLSDDGCSPVVYISGDLNGDLKLDTTETWTYTCKVNIVRTTTNTVTVSGDANGLTQRDLAIAIVAVAASNLPADLLQQIRAITSNLGVGSVGDDVRVLQRFIIFENRGPAAVTLGNHGTTLNFGLMTQAALLEWQKAVGLALPTGNFGAATRAYISEHYLNASPNLPDAGLPSYSNFTSLAAIGLKDGDVVGSSPSGDPDIYIVNQWGYKRLFLNPVIFSFYGHLGGFSAVKNLATSTRNMLIASGLFRNCETNNPKVYGLQITGEDSGTLHWINTTGEQAVVDDKDFFKKVFCINTNEFNWYQKGVDYTSVNQVPSYSR